MINPEIQKEIISCIKMLRQGGYVFFPSETGWNIGCDAASEELVSNLIRSENNSFSAMLLQDSGRLHKYLANIPESAYDLIEYTQKPLHLIFEEAVNLPCATIKNIKTIRIPKDDFTVSLLTGFSKPIFTVTLESGFHPEKSDSFLNTPCYMVNLRAAAYANTDHLVTIRYSKGGSFSLIKNH